MHVHLTVQARIELFEIGEWIERDSPAHAALFVEELYNACMSLGETPNAYPLLLERPQSGIRKRVNGDYLIFYVVGERVDVLHIIHGAGLWRHSLFLASLPSR